MISVLVWQGYFDVSMSLVAVISFFSGAIYLISAPETSANSNSSEILRKRGGFADISRLFLSACLLCVLIFYFYSHRAHWDFVYLGLCSRGGLSYNPCDRIHGLIRATVLRLFINFK